METQVESRSPEETLAIGHQIASMLNGGEVMLVDGLLGAGKSVLVRGIVAGLGNVEWRGSPTFTIVNEYSTSPRVHHSDLYRLDKQEVEGLGLEEYVRSDSVLVVEWPERARDYLERLTDGQMIQVHLRLVGRDERLITLSGLPRPLSNQKPE